MKLAIGIMGSSTICRGRKSVITVNEAPATLGTIASVLSYSGSVTPRWTVDVMPKISGTISPGMPSLCLRRRQRRIRHRCNAHYDTAAISHAQDRQRRRNST